MRPVPIGIVLKPGDTRARPAVFAVRSPNYDALPALVYEDGTVCTEWALSEEEREQIRRGENVRLWIVTRGLPLQPVMLEVTDEEK